MRARRCPVCCKPLQCYCTIGANHISLLHLRKVIQLQVDLAEWRRHLLSYNVLRSLCVALHPSGCALSNVHCSVHYKLDAIVRRPQYTTEIRLNIRCPLDMSRGHRICCRICTYNYLQYTEGAYRSRAHFPSQHELGPRTPPLGVLTTCSWHGRNTCVCCSAPSALYRSAANRQAPERRHAGRSDCAFVMEGKHNLCLVGCCSLPA